MAGILNNPTLAVHIVACVSLFASTVTAQSGRQCYQCVNIGVDSSSTVVQKLFRGKSDPACYPLQSYATSTVTCSSPSDMCALVRVQVQADIHLAGTVTLSIQARGCMSSYVTGCLGSEQAKRYINEGIIKSHLSASSGVSIISVDGDACVCDKDHCDANDAGCKGPFSIGSFCVTWLMIGGTAGGLVVLIVACGCCCYCCCCRTSGNSHGRRVPTIEQPQSTMMTLPAGQNQPAMLPQANMMTAAQGQGPPAMVMSPDGTTAFSNAMYHTHNP